MKSRNSIIALTVISLFLVLWYTYTTVNQVEPSEPPIEETQRHQACYPPPYTRLQQKFKRPEGCPDYQLPNMPKEIAELEYGIHIPPLAPIEQQNYKIMWDSNLLWDMIANYGGWGTRFPLCTIPDSYALLLDSIFSQHLALNWKMIHNNSAPCDLIYVNISNLVSTTKMCGSQYECLQNPKGGSLGLLSYMPSVVFAGVMYLPPKFMWILSRFRSPKSIWIGKLLRESLVNYPAMTHPFYKAMLNVSVGYSRFEFDVAVIPRSYTFESGLRNPPPLVPLRERKGTALAFWLQSNCFTASRRSIIIHQLLKYMDIDIYGPCERNKELPEWAKKYGEDNYEIKRALLENYPFVLGLENSITNDYVTEKFWQPLAFGSVPIYLGAETVEDFLPIEYDPDNPVYINLADWESLEHLAFYLKALVADEQLYNRFHKWREIPMDKRQNSIFFRWLDSQGEWDQEECGYCKTIHRGNFTHVAPPPTHFKHKDIHPAIQKAFGNDMYYR